MTQPSLDLTHPEAFAQYLSIPPQITSDRAQWSNLTLIHYHQHPGWEFPEFILKQHVLEAIAGSSGSHHERRMGKYHQTYQLKSGEICFCPAQTRHWTVWTQPISFTILEISLENLPMQWIYFLNIQDIAPDLYRAKDGALLREVLRSHPERDRIVAKALQPGVLEKMQQLEKANPVPQYLLASLTESLPNWSPLSIPTFGLWGETTSFSGNPKSKTLENT
ncbi:MAG: hypothetical protein F6K03_05650 [Kamptonema sp. SIO4C4]|nr:hypothetical protein [Kamptonema sp. SIO4C4]